MPSCGKKGSNAYRLLDHYVEKHLDKYIAIRARQADERVLSPKRRAAARTHPVAASVTHPATTTTTSVEAAEDSDSEIIEEEDSGSDVSSDEDSKGEADCLVSLRRSERRFRPTKEYAIKGVCSSDRTFKKRSSLQHKVQL